MAVGSVADEGFDRESIVDQAYCYHLLGCARAEKTPTPEGVVTLTLGW
jgi:hypothetical protein